MKSYLKILEDIISFGELKHNRTGIDTLSLVGVQIRHDMREGFPLLTTKKMFPKSIFVELEGFIKGITDKRWYQERGCSIWDEWCNPKLVPYGHDEVTKSKMKSETDLGPIYGKQWRDWNGHDQLMNVIETLKKDPFSRRMVINAWNVDDLDSMALAPCHYSFQFLSNGKDLDLIFTMRSNDYCLGAPYNIASYAMLLTLVGLECGLKPRFLVGNMADCHIYVNHLDGAKEMLKREPRKLPNIIVPNFQGVNLWQHEQYELVGYDPHPKIHFPVAV